jgi:hypothetical protein
VRRFVRTPSDDRTDHATHHRKASVQEPRHAVPNHKGRQDDESELHPIPEKTEREEPSERTWGGEVLYQQRHEAGDPRDIVAEFL